MAVVYNPFTGMLDLIGTSGGGGGSVTSVNGQTGIVVLDANDIGLGNVDNTSDADKPISDATQAALDAITVPVGPVTLIDNTTATAFTVPATNRKVLVDYSITRNSQTRDGQLEVACNGSVASHTDDYVETVDLGILWSVSVSAGNINFNYTSTNAGFNGSLKYILRNWS